ncbi:NFX1-type zinc finger-containing protein 1-like [Patella vulgata]|uniref:NFX1-type zinc finger-containing protein 1-like n=1 Tax=Patella vulgata TaxID=6465 RepID=UPI0024A893E9|nr:NFX1-type zinc finger-containing protein 1-like [Patella vulgata]
MSGGPLRKLMERLNIEEGLNDDRPQPRRRDNNHARDVRPRNLQMGNPTRRNVMLSEEAGIREPNVNRRGSTNDIRFTGQDLELPGVNLDENRGHQGARGRGRGGAGGRGRGGRGRHQQQNPVVGNEVNNRGRGNQRHNNHNTARGGRRYQSGDRNKSREREREIDVLNWRRLQEYKRKDPSEILVSLGHDYSGLQELLNSTRQDPNIVTLLLSVIAKACTCESMPQNLNNILVKLPRSVFLSVGLPCIILRLQDQDETRQRNIIIDTLVTLKELLIRVPGSYADQSGVLATLRKEVDSLRETSDVIDNDIMMCLDEVSDLEASKHKKMRDVLSHGRTHRVDEESHPPDEYREMSLLPTLDDLNPNVQPFLRKNKKTGRYDDVNHYLDVQFRLLREDFIQPLRNGIAEYQKIIDEPKKSRNRLQDIRVYKDVSVIRSVCSKTDLLHRIQFDVSSLQRVKWEMSKRLIYGSLICLSSDNFQTFYIATVSDRDPKLLKDGYIDVKFEQNLEEINAIDTDQRFVMVETTAYYEAYKHVLRGLQNITKLPFEKYIVQCQNVVNVPKYLTIGRKFDLRPLIDDDIQLREDTNLRIQGRTDRYNFSRKSMCAEKVNVVDLQSWPSHEMLNLDESQFRALQTALTKEFSVIQGPPGTGKTYVGLKIVKALLHNSKHWDEIDSARRPMLIVCYTNHALDQFLSGIVEFYKGSVIRVGGRISDSNLEKYSLRSWKKKAREEGRYKNLARLGFIHGDKLRSLHQRIESVSQRIDAAEGDILTEDTLQHVMSHRHSDQFEIVRNEIMVKNMGYQAPQISSLMVEWLGLGASSQFVFDVIDEAKNENPEDQVEEVIEVQGDYDVARNNRILFEDADEARDNSFERVIQDSLQLKKTCIALDISNLDKDDFQSHDGFQIPKVQRKKLKRKIRQKIKSKSKMTVKEAENVNDIWNIDFDSRWRLYRYWVSRFREQLRADIIDKSQAYKVECTAQREVMLEKEKSIMSEASVIAMTTTGAARYQAILQDINPRIIVVEEAAEVLEGHVITTLAKDCEQLILIGDHKQLRPNPNVYKLATQYNLQISLFERMLTNGVHCDCLQLQHRMRPEISKLMKPIYPELRDHSSVHGLEHVKGVEKNIFFINHNHKEERDEENKSHSNIYEAQFVVALADYLTKQGYSRQQITILTTYSGQMFQLRKLMPKTRFEGIRVTPVDNFQGEENDIIILSLVRSNDENKIGFLKIENRICVALSRAKKGLYVIGNFDILQSESSLWKEMTIMLKKSGEIGERLILKCQNHPEDPGIEIGKPGDFQKAPAGGCQKLCNARLDCGHSCVMSCHPLDLEHEEYQCHKPCPKTCSSNHPCKRKCYQDCGDCTTRVTKLIPRCGHFEKVSCHMKPEDHKCTQTCMQVLPCGHLCGNQCGFRHQCKKMITKTWPCGHKGEVKCEEKDSAICRLRCDKILACGHQCRGTCSTCLSGRLHESCKEHCTKTLVCAHNCQSYCSDCPPCVMKCRNKCPHSKCTKSCGELCKPCKEPCTWACEHHQCTMLCSEPCNRPRCDSPCKKFLKCGHPCIGLCGEPCPRYCRRCNADVVTDIFFGTEDEPDARFVELKDCKHIVEYNSLDAWIDQDTSSDKASFVQLKCCPRCKTPIRRSVRYGTIINRLLQNIDQVKEKYIGNRADIELRRNQIKRDLRKATLKCQPPKFPFMVSNENNRRNRVKAIDELGRHLDICVSEKELITLQNQLNFLVKAADRYSKFNDFVKSETLGRLRNDEFKEIELGLQPFIDWITVKRSSLSEQEIKDVQNELIRHNLLYKLFINELTIEKRGLQIPSNTKSQLEKCKLFIETGLTFTQKNKDDLENTMKMLEQISPPSGLGITDDERVMIVSAMQLSKGHWYKCKNGHVYAIGECGGATVEGKCPECQTSIGGSGYRLRDDNALASEMDGARYSEQAFLRNYHLDF